jgi:putative flippase GtrA
MIKQLTRYISVGMVNTLIHWLVFAIIWYGTASPQGLSNLIAFCVAVTFSFFANSRFTFNSRATLHRYLIYVAFLGALSIVTGMVADQLNLPPLFTLVMFSASSLFLGFIYSRYIVFKEIK